MVHWTGVVGVMIVRVIEAGKTDDLVNVELVRIDPERLVFVNFAPAKFASVKSDPANDELIRTALLKFAPVKTAATVDSSNLVLLRFAPVRSLAVTVTLLS